MQEVKAPCFEYSRLRATMYGSLSSWWLYVRVSDLSCCQLWEILTSMLFRVLKYIRSCSLLNAWFGYWKLKVENGDSGSSKMSKSAISFSSLVSLRTPVFQKEYDSCFVNVKKNIHNIQTSMKTAPRITRKSVILKQELYSPVSHTQVGKIPSFLAC